MSIDLTSDVGLFERRRAVFSPCRRYRYLLESVWDPGAGIVSFVILNPSTADETDVNPTNVRCRGFVERWGFGGLSFVNLFAWRATDPRDMIAAAEPVGPENDAAILDACRGAPVTVCAWGNDGAHLGRARHVVRLLTHAGIALHALRINGSGAPAHPLYLPYGLTPEPWEAAP